MESPRFSMTEDQWLSLGKSLIKYTAPLFLVFLVAIQAGTPLKDAVVVLWGAALQVVINFLSKFTSETK